MTNTAKRTIIGLEEHWIDETLEKALPTEGVIHTANLPSNPKVNMIFGLARDLETQRIAMMNRAGVSMQVLSHSAPGVQGLHDANEAVTMAHVLNDFTAKVCSRHPAEFACFAELPMQAPEEAAKELERCVKELGFKGGMLNGRLATGEYYDENKFWCVWEKAEELNVPFYLHPFPTGTPGDPRLFEGHPELKGAAWVWNMETATAALRLVGSGLFDAYPGCKVIMGHLGEGLPYFMGRIDEGTNPHLFSDRKLKKPFSEYIRSNLYVTTSGGYRPETLVCAISAMGIDHVLYSDDYPFFPSDKAVEMVEAAPISESEKEHIFHINAEKLLGINLPVK